MIGDYESLDKVNYGLYSNIRLVGSVHPKTGEVLRIEYAFAPFLDGNTLKINPNYYMDKNEYFYNSFIDSLSYLNKMEKMNNIIKSRSKYSNFTKSSLKLLRLIILYTYIKMFFNIFKIYSTTNFTNSYFFINV